MGQTVVAINIFACLLYMYGIYGGMMTLRLGSSKILLHAIVAIIIHTLFTIQSSNKHE